MIGAVAGKAPATMVEFTTDKVKTRRIIYIVITIFLKSGKQSQWLAQKLHVGLSKRILLFHKAHFAQAVNTVLGTATVYRQGYVLFPFYSMLPEQAPSFIRNVLNTHVATLCSHVASDMPVARLWRLSTFVRCSVDDLRRLVADEGDNHAVEVEEEHEQVEAELDKGFLRGVSYEQGQGLRICLVTDLLVNVKLAEDLRSIKKMGVVDNPEILLAYVTNVLCDVATNFLMFQPRRGKLRTRATQYPLRRKRRVKKA